MDQNIIWNITFYVGPECNFFYGILPFSMAFNNLKDFHDFSWPGNQSFKFHDFSRFSMNSFCAKNILRNRFQVFRLTPWSKSNQSTPLVIVIEIWKAPSSTNPFLHSVIRCWSIASSNIVTVVKILSALWLWHSRFCNYPSSFPIHSGRASLIAKCCTNLFTKVDKLPAFIFIHILSILSCKDNHER